MSSTVILKASGLQTSQNQLEVSEGALTEASNIIIKRDNMIEPRRGFKLHGNELPSENDRVKQLFTYRNRLLRHYDDKLQFDSDGAGLFEDYLNDVIETETGLRIKSVESNGNLYLTTSEGIKKLSAKTSAQLDEIQPELAGAVKALDLEGKVKYTANSQTGFFVQDSVVAYRVVWLKKDKNNNRIDGTPSQRAVIYNPLAPLIARDFVRNLSTLDNLLNTSASSARISDGNYVSTLLVGVDATASELRTNLIALATKLDTDIFLADQGAVAPIQITSAAIAAGICTITCSGADVTTYISAGGKIKLAGFSAATGTLETDVTATSTTATTIVFNTTASGIVTITSGEIRLNEFRSITEPSVPNIPATNDDLVELQDYLDTINLTLQELPTTIIASGTDADNIANLDITTTTTVNLSFTIPEEIAEDSTYFYQIYRSAMAQATGASVLDDLSPNDELQLVYEDYPTTAELAALEINIEDVTPEDFRGENLYTNASTGEGITQANDQPPFAKDINRYRNSVFFANTRTKQRLSLNLLGVQKMIDDYDAAITPKITITNGTVTSTYEFVTGQQEITEIECVADVADSLNGKYFLLPAKTGNNLAPYLDTGTAVAPVVTGYTAVQISISTGDSANTIATKLSDVLSTYIADFIVSVVTDTVEVINVDVGELEDAVDVDTGFTFTITQQGRGESIKEQITEITAVAGNLYVSSGVSDYLTINTAFNQNRYLLWFKSGTSTEPSVAGKTNIEITVTGVETAPEMAAKIVAALPTTKFTTEIASNVVTVYNTQYGSCDNATEVVADAGFTVTTEQVGALQVLLSPLISPARAVDATAKSLTKVINKNLGDSVYAYYLSGALDIPGKFLLEARSLQDDEPFYVVANNDNTGSSFNPNISPELTITSISAHATAPVITTASAHGMTTGDEVVLGSTNSQPIVDGLYTITKLTDTTFSISSYVAIAGTEGVMSRESVTLVSEDEEKTNRVYYSKYQQPEAVPIVNFFDVGSQDKAILRIVPLRDSLFVFKEDGLYRISGETAPFQLELFDNSFILLAPDSVAVCNNVIYAWTTQGIQSLSEGGAYVISRPIDNIILQIQSSNYTNFTTATWGIGYESDNSYIVFTVNEEDDEVAEIAYRYSTITQTWTTYDKSNSCGVINNFDDKLYLGATDVAYIEQERKSFNRTDYADREIESSVSTSGILGTKLRLPVVTGFSEGDVLTQTQSITVYNYNQLLEKLDMDTGFTDPDFYETLEMSQGESPRNKLLELAVKLDDSGLSQTDYEASIATESGSITAIEPLAGVTIITSAAHGLFTGRVVQLASTDSVPVIDNDYVVTVLTANTFSVPVTIREAGTTGTFVTVDTNFDDLKACFNKITEKLNDDNIVNFNNYREITTNTLQEAIITDVNNVTREVTVNMTLDFLAGDLLVYKSIPTAFTYARNTMGDPLMMKHLSEATIMFETRTLTSAILSFATDLLPQFIPVPFTLDGNGIFGHSSFGTNFFGGNSNSAPFRTYVPRQCMRCRYIIVRYQHNTARESYQILGVTVTGNIGISTRAYR